MRGPFADRIGLPALLAIAALGLGFGLSAARPALAAGPKAASNGDDDDDDERPPQGLKLTVRAVRGGTASDRAEDRDVRLARLVALRVPAGEPPTPFLPAGPFRASWEGSLAVALPGPHTFAASCRGSVRVEVNGRAALEGSGDGDGILAGKPVDLKSGANAIVVRFDSPPSGDAALRLFWSSPDFAREPVPIAALGHDAKAKDLAAGLRLREGRSLIASLRCLKCHREDAPTSGGMPELDLDAPSLADAGARLNPAWMARWIADPRSLRPDASMPRLLHGAPKAEGAAIDPRARDIAAYLATLGKADEAGPAAASADDAKAGGRLFGQLGCVGCHSTPDLDDWKTIAPDRVPLRDVGAKWRPKPLVAFLLRPDRHYASIRMPDFHLSPAEAAGLAAYLLAPPRAGLDAPESSPAPDVARGRALVRSSGCLSCHALEGVPNEHRAPSYRDLSPDSWDRGCLATGPSPDRKAPDFGLTDEQVEALQAFATDARGSLTRESMPEFAERQVRALRCNACHRRDGQDDAWTESQAEVDALLAAAPPSAEESASAHKYPALQARPQLTWVGEKLKPEWMAAFLAGAVPEKPRPYLRARMPAFSRWAAPLTRGLVLEHGCPTASPPDPAPDPARAAVGKALARANGGLACVSCHQVGRVEAVGVFEAPGVNFQYVKERLRRDYYDRWIRSPIRVDPETKMPTFFNGDRSALPTVLDGDASRQAEALWQYLLEGRTIEPPGN